MKVLFIGFSDVVHPWYDDFIEAIAGKHSVELYDPHSPMAPQFCGGVQLRSWRPVTNFRADSCMEEGIGNSVDPHNDSAPAFVWQSWLCECQ